MRNTFCSSPNVRTKINQRLAYRNNITLTKTLILFFFTVFATAFAFGQNPVANFTANVTSGCAPLSVTFTDQSTGNPTGWNWEFSNGTLSSVQNPTVTFSTPGTYTAKLVVQNATGVAEQTRVNYITVFPSPAASFKADLTLGCVPSTIHFNDLSTPPGGITSWQWDFGDGGTSTAQNPDHPYTNIGFYSVTLTVTSINGCKATSTAGSYIRIVGGVTTDFDFAPPTTCRPPFNVPFQNLSSGPGNVNYTWNFGNSTSSTAQNPTGNYATPGSYTVTLNAVSDLGCTGSKTKTVTINQTVTDFTAPSTICLNQPVTLQNSSTPAPVTSTWDFGDGTGTSQTNPSKTYLTPGAYTVKLINEYAGCKDSAFHPVTVADKPAVDFIADDVDNCKFPFPVQFTDQTPGATSWLWEFGDGTTSTLQNPPHTYNQDGEFTVSLTVTTAGGCSNTLVKPAYIKIHPTTIHLNLPSGGCAGFSWTPVLTTNTLDPIVSYAWNFGNGNTSTSPTPGPQVYNTVGSYDISLTVTTANGCTVTENVPKGILIGTLPTVDFSFTPSVTCAESGVPFTENVIFSPGAEKTWIWDFGDGSNTSGEQNPTHVFEDTGTRQVKLTALNNRCAAFITKDIKILPPIAKFSYTVDCFTGEVTFVDESIVDPALLPLTYEWDFGDGLTYILGPTPPAHIYTSPGTKTVSLKVTNGTCSYTFQDDVVITTEPADFSIVRNPVCKNEEFTMTSTAANPSNVLSYKWVIGVDTLPVTGQSVTWKLPDVGAYDVSLVIDDVNGCRSVRKEVNYLNVNGPAANFSFSAPGACYNKPYTFNDLSTPAGTISNWKFDFGDGSQQTFTNPPFTHIYSVLGAYNVSLKVTDNAGCTDSIALPDQLLVTNAMAGFRADTFYCPQAPLQFVDTSSGVGLLYQWTFGDGNTSTLQNPTNAYPAGDASYTVKLKITDISGCSDSVTKTQYINIRTPKAAFQIFDTTTICPPLNTSFLFQGADYKSFNWDFGDGATSPVQSPNHFYGTFGHYVPTLTLTGPGGCTNSASATVSVYNPNASQINYGPLTTACNSLNVDFNLVLPPGFPFYFAFGDGINDSTGRTSFSHFYPRPSLNLPILFLIDTAEGCRSTVYGNPRIDVLGAIPLFGKDKEEFCDQGTVQFKDFTTKNEPIRNLLWSFGDGGTSTATDPPHTYTQPGLYEVTLDVTTVSDCSSSFKDTVLVYRTPAPSILSRDTICLNTTEPFTGVLTQADTAIKYQWTFGNGQTGSDSISNVTYSTPGDFPITLTTTNKIGCSASANKSIHVATPPTAIPAEDPITIISGGSTPLAMTYTGNIVSYNWVPDTRLSCTDCPIPIANPRFTTKYNVHITDVYGCETNKDVTVVVVCNNQNFFMPNTFSPNGDGHNETFFPRGTGLFNIRSFTVFNRWGQIVFEKKNMPVNDPAAGWNGTFKGQKASPDVYVYILEILCDNGTVIPVKGNVTLLR